MATARFLNCHITAGYPEICTEDSQPLDSDSLNGRCYNSTITVSPTGQVLANYRKSHLYYTDETWALPNPSRTPGPHFPESTAPHVLVGQAERTHPGPHAQGFYAGKLGALSEHLLLHESPNISLGICMDINPHRFLAPWTAYEFANHCLQNNTKLVVVSMAWLTRLEKGELKELPYQPDLETLTYWLERFHPLRTAGAAGVNPQGRAMQEGQASSRGSNDGFVVVCANRCGSEGEACYAGTSCVVGFQGGRTSVWGVLGKCEEKVLVVDLSQVSETIS